MEISRLTTPRRPVRVLFTSTDHRAGTTSLTAATALGLARNLRVDVGLVETNLESPKLAEYLEISEDVGLSDLLDQRVDLAEAVQVVEVVGPQRVNVVPGGSPRLPRPGEFAAEESHKVVERLGEFCDYILFDAPPLLDHIEARVLLHEIDAVVIVLRAGISKRARAQKLVQTIEEQGIRVLGTILNRLPGDQAA